MSVFTAAMAVRWVTEASSVYIREKEHLTALDAVIGDADHGANMARGFSAAAEKLRGLGDREIGEVFKTTAMTLITTVGGASGPLYGSFFLQAAVPAAGKKELTATELGACLEAGLKAVLARGKAVPGEKTMIDALQPGVEAFQEAAEESLEIALQKACMAVAVGALTTIPLQARKGRASYLGERSVGHLDPGAQSCVYLLESLRQAASLAGEN